ncbi:alpha/beta fold hydrolase [Ekhidna sp.]|uniref:alpha/beta hydrolase family protein n=1 Tax=Ekhidna sp. TaxID=2608089 RepID=UPI003299B977
MREVEIESGVGVITATIYDSIDPNTVLVIASATGVKQSFYKKFAEYLSSQNVTVITFDYYGIGLSLKGSIKKLTNDAEGWGAEDLESVIDYALNNFVGYKKSLLGHSIGGQLVGLSKSSTKMDKIVLVAAQSGYWKLWDGVGRIKLWFNWHILFPLLTNLFGYLPSKKISGMENLPKNVANQWSKWGKNKDYLLSDKSLKETFFEKYYSEIAAFSIDDDDFAPRKAVEWMTGRYSNAKTKTRHLIPKDYNTQKIGHFGVFKERFKDTIWKDLLNEIK